MDKNALDYCRELSLEVADLDQRIDQLRSKVESRKWPDGLPHSNYAADRLSGIVAKIADLDAVRRPKAAELAQLRGAIEDAMVSLSPAERRLIRLRYMDGFRWSKVAEKMGYSERQIYRYFETAIEKMSANVS